MKPNLTKKDYRQITCVQRGQKARYRARMLIPVTAVMFSTALWSDPVAQPQMRLQFESAKLMAQVAMDGGTFREMAAAAHSAKLPDMPGKAKLAGLPAARLSDSKIRVNRP
ncbi:hypothetical protein [uncultured Roseobacter sp.]|uniref:hypothetical protein n=1 Tax=uncultured Roseobacter sp. TaxID=114847 RepID=UPI002601BE56|nr:hypothetical protein [uncultured Roseobacter sp.]